MAVKKSIKNMILRSAFLHDFSKATKEGLFLVRSLRALGDKLLGPRKERDVAMKMFKAGRR